MPSNNRYVVRWHDKQDTAFTRMFSRRPAAMSLRQNILNRRDLILDGVDSHPVHYVVEHKVNAGLDNWLPVRSRFSNVTAAKRHAVSVVYDWTSANHARELHLEKTADHTQKKMKHLGVSIFRVCEALGIKESVLF